MQVSIVLDRLLAMNGHTLDSFAQPRQEARERLHHAIDLLNQAFGNGSVYFGGAFGVTANAPMRISYTCIPKPELEEIDLTRPGRLRPQPRRIRLPGSAPIARLEIGDRYVMDYELVAIAKALRVSVETLLGRMG